MKVYVSKIAESETIHQNGEDGKGQENGGVAVSVRKCYNVIHHTEGGHGAWLNL